MGFKNYKQSFNLLTVLSLCAIVTSTATAAIEQESKKQNFNPVNEQQSVSQNSIDRLNKSDTAVVEEIDLDKEWEGILGNQSEQGLLLAANTL